MRGLPGREWSIERLLRRSRPVPRDEFVRGLTARVPSRPRAARPALRVAILTATMAIGLAAVGGLGYAMTLSGGFVVKITHISIAKTGVPHTAHFVAADDQYGTTTTSGGGGGGGSTTTTTQAPPPPAPTTTNTTTTVAAGSTAQLTLSAGGTTAITVSGSTAGAPAATVTVLSNVFATQVTLKVAPSAGVSSFGGASATPAVQALTTAPPSKSTYVSISAATTSDGTSVTSLSAPMEIDFSNVSSDWQPFYVNSGGFHWLPALGSALTSCPDSTTDGYVRSGSNVAIYTCHLTVFGAASPAVVPVSETGKPTPAAGSGKFGDPARNHFGAPVFTKAAASKPAHDVIPVKFSVDEQAQVFVSVAGASLTPVGSRTTGGSIQSKKASKTLELLILKPGTVSAGLDALGLKPGRTYTITLTAVDFDGHKVTRTAKVTTPAAAKPKPKKKVAPPSPPAKKVPANHWGPFKASVAAKLPSRSSGTVATTGNGKVYVVSGRQVLAGSNVGGLRRIATLPASVASAQLIVSSDGASLYVVGGEQGGKPANRIYRVDLATGAVKNIGKFVEPLAEGQVVQGTSASYIVGGWTGAKFASAVLLFASPSDIELAARLPVGLRAPAVAELNGTIYVAGGQRKSGALSKAVYAVDPLNHKAKKIGSLPVGVAHGTLLVRGAKLYLVGGDEVIRIDPKSGATAAAGASNPVAGGSGFSFGGKLYVADGTSGRVYRLR